MRACAQLIGFIALCSLLPAATLHQASARPASAQSHPNKKSPGGLLQLTPQEIAIYQEAPTVVDWTPQQIKDCPVLHKLRPAGSQKQLTEILKRAGEVGVQSFQNFPQVACDEAVTSETRQGSHTDIKHQEFQYIVLPGSANSSGVLEEYRTNRKGSPATKFNLNHLYMLTSGFASSWLYLSPAQQRDSRFRYFGVQKIRKRECRVVAFAQVPTRASALEEFHDVNGKRAALLVQGLAWIDSETFQTLRIMTWLLAPRMDVSLSTQISTIDFYPVQPAGMSRVLWLPRKVDVWVVYRGVGVRNIHRYSKFKLFRVESTIIP